MSESKIMKCTCEHKYQDKKYGKGNRVHNEITRTTNLMNWRCTVCGKEKA